MSAAAGPREIVLDLPDLTMTALEWGPPDGRLALCAHGFPDSAHGWRLLAPLLAEKGFRVVAPFMRAYAPTGPAPDGDYTIGALMSDLIAAHRALGSPPDAVLIGHDWGGWTTGSMAGYDGSPFTAHISLALAPVGAISPPRGLGLRGAARLARRQLRNSWYIVVNQLPRLPERVFASMTGLLWREWAPGYDAAVDLAHLADAAPPRNRAAIVGYYRQMVRPRPGSALTRELTKLFMAPPIHPVQVLYGSDDHAMRAQFFAGLDDGRLPEGSRVERLEGLGHFLHLERPEQVNALIVDHLGPA